MKVLKNRPTNPARDTNAWARRLQPPIRSSPAELLGGDLRTRYNCSEPVLSPGAVYRWLDQGGERAAQRHMRMCVFLRLEQAESPVSAVCRWMVLVWVVWGGHCCRCGGNVANGRFLRGFVED